MKRFIFILSLLALSLVFAGTAYAGTATSTLGISGTVQTTCEISTTAVDFGNIVQDSVTPTYANGDVSVTCVEGIAYVIDLDYGMHYGGDGRYIADSGNTHGIAYYLYKDSGYLNEWGDSGHANTYPWGSGLGDTGTGGAQSHTVYGSLGPIPPTYADTYTDTVTVTVYF